MAYSDPDKQRAWRRADYARKREQYCAEKRERYAANPAPFLESSRRSRLKNIEARKAYDAEYGRAYYAKNRDAILERTAANERARYHSDPAYAEARRIRCRTRQAFARIGAAKPTSTIGLLGCTAQELKTHIESQFVNGMSWENRDEWHVDHIHPLCAVNLFDPMEATAVCSVRNLRPLWRSDNQRKGGRVTPESAALFESILQEQRERHNGTKV